MAEHQAMNVQCFVKKDFQSVFTGKNNPKLLYVSDIRPDTSAHPARHACARGFCGADFNLQRKQRVSHS